MTEEIVVKFGRTAVLRTGSRRLCIAGGVALNCVANAALARARLFHEIWIQPAAGDAGGAVGAALYGCHQILGHARSGSDVGKDGMAGAYLGPSFDDGEIEKFLTSRGSRYRRLEASEWAQEIAQRIASQRVVGVMFGRMEFGPRALGHRSILADPRSPEMRTRLNSLTKGREAFRPFAPAVPRERAADYFEADCESPYMLFTTQVKNDVASMLPVVTHVDGSARVQTVDRNVCARFHALLTAFGEITGMPVLVNTSFNVRGGPIVCSPADAYRCFMQTDMDVLILESYLLEKAEQPPLTAADSWSKPFMD